MAQWNWIAGLLRNGHLWQNSLTRLWQTGTNGTPDPSIPSLPVPLGEVPRTPPQIASQSNLNDSSAGTTKSITLPSGITAGDTLLLFFATENQTATTPSGWTLLTSVSPSGSFYIFGRIADGTEGSTVSVTISAGNQASAVCYRITGSTGSLSDVEISSASSGFTTTPNSPSLTASWGLDNNLWITAFAQYESAGSVTSYPVGYDRGRDFVESDPGAGNGGSGIGTAAKSNYSATNDPPSFTLSASKSTSAFTIVVRPQGITNLTLAADAGSFALTGSAAGLRVGRFLAAGTGTFALTGQPATLREAKKLIADAGTFSLTGQAATLRHTYAVAAGAGTFALTGQAATLRRGLVVTASSTTFTWDGQPANLVKLRGVIAGSGSFALTGSAAGLVKAWKVAAGTASFTLSGQPAGLRRGRNLVASSATFTLTGQAAGLRKGWRVAAGTATFTLNGQPATLRRGLVVTAGAGTFTLTGSDAGLVKFGVKALAADPGSFALTGQPAGLRLARKVAAGTASFALTGQAAALKVARKVAAASGSFALTGQPAGLREARKVIAGSGTFTLTGQPASLRRGRKVAAGTATFVLTGFDASFDKTTATGQATGGGDSTPGRIIDPDRWWKSPPRKRRKAQTTDTGAPIEAPLSVSDEAQSAVEDAINAARRAKAARDAQAAVLAEQERQRIAADIAEAELLLLLAA